MNKSALLLLAGWGRTKTTWFVRVPSIHNNNNWKQRSSHTWRIICDYYIFSNVLHLVLFFFSSSFVRTPSFAQSSPIVTCYNWMAWWDTARGEATRRRCNGNGLEEVIRGNGNREGRGGGRCFYLRKMKARSAQERASGFQGTDWDWLEHGHERSERLLEQATMQCVQSWMAVTAYRHAWELWMSEVWGNFLIGELKINTKSIRKMVRILQN